MTVGTSLSLTFDQDLERRVANFLASCHMSSLRKLDVEVQEGVVTLRGQVQSFYEKQVSHLCCRRVAGVHGLVDAVDVVTTAEPAA